MSDVQVRLEGEDPSGLAELVAGLLQQHLAREPSRASGLRPAVVVLSVPDAEVAVTVRLSRGIIRVADGDAADAHLRIVAPSGRLLALAAAPLRAGMPDPLTRDGRVALADVLTGRVRVHGLLRHPRRLAGFTSVLSVHEAESGRRVP